MSLMFGRVRQDSYDVQPEGIEHNLRVNPRGELVGVDWMTQLAMDGVVYNISSLIQEAGDLAGETGPGTDNVAPSFLVDVPNGTTIIPLEAQFVSEGTGTSGDWTIRMNKDTLVRYTSGGGTNIILNMREDQPNSSVCTARNAGTAIVAVANTNDDTFWVSGRDDSSLALGGVYWSAKNFIPPILIGPASWLVYITVSNVNEEINYSMKWAEFSTTDIT